MKLIVAVVHNEDAGALVDALLDKEFRATRLHSSGGFLKQSNATIVVGVEDADVDEVMGHRPRELRVAHPGGESDAADHGTGRILHALSARGRGRRGNRIRRSRRAVRAAVALSPLRPDLVDCWIFRPGSAEPDILLMRRSPGRILPGLWQCVSGAVEDGERITGAALRELAEETGFGAAQIEAFYDLDLVNQFHEFEYDAVLTAAVFAVRIRGGIEPTLSTEHDATRWMPLSEAHREVVWPGYRTALERIRDDLSNPARAAWFELALDGARRERW